MKSLHVKKGDKVTVITGKDRGKIGTVLRVFPKQERVIVEGLNVAKRHEKPRQNRKGGIIDKSMPIHVSNVKLTKEGSSSKKKKTSSPAKKK